jgi:two-component system, sensor histidine kinase
LRSDLFEIVANYTYDWESWFLPDGRVRWINPAVERMTGFTVDECLDMADYPLDIVHAEDRAAVKTLLQSALSGTSGNDVEFRISRKDGKTGWAAVSWQPMVDADGKQLGIRTSVRDISWRKRAEEALRLAKSDAERADKAKSRFLAAASHDLRQPLQAIGLYIAALACHPLDDASQSILDDIRKCLGASSELLEDLVDISRLDAGVVVPEFADVAIADVFELLEKSFQREADARHIELRFVPRSLFVRADPGILGRILQNIVSNALHYTAKGRVLVGCRSRNGAVAMEVWDTGIGIAPEEKEHIFEEFYQVDNPARDRRRGIGLGLAIVRRQAALIGARVSVRSTPGKGSVFSITLPLAESHDCAAPAAEDSEFDFKGRIIAIIDDEPLQLNALQSFLSLHQARVIAGESIIDILKQLDNASVQPELIIADYRLEAGMTGADAIAAVRFRIGKPVPGILVTGDTEPQRIAEAEASGCWLLHKPVDPGKLAKTIDQVLIGR